MKQDFSVAVRSMRYRTFDAAVQPVFTILIPSWNNLPFLRLALQSLRKNSTHPHQVVVHVNEGGDGTPAWLESERVDFTWTQSNEDDFSYYQVWVSTDPESAGNLWSEIHTRELT